MAANFSLIFIIAITIFILYSIVLCSNNLSRGFGDNIDWKTLDDGLQESKRSGKPLMIIIHKTWCGACKALKPKLAASKHIEDLSRNFVMVNAQDSEEPTDKKFSPDGSYIPRILFLDSAGEVKEDLYNENGNSNYKYFYSDPGQVIEVMKKAIKEIPTKIINDVPEDIYQSSRKNDEL